MSESSRKKSVKMSCSIKEAAERLRQIAHGLENGQISIEGNGYEIPRTSSVKVGLRSKGERLDLKVKIKPERATGDGIHKHIEKKKQTGIGKEKKTSPPSVPLTFKKLKKRLSKDLGSITKTVSRSEALPDPETVQSFYSDAKAMAEYPEAEGMDFTFFLDQLDEMILAYQRSDSPAMKTALSSLNQQKKECHRKYK